MKVYSPGDSRRSNCSRDSKLWTCKAQARNTLQNPGGVQRRRDPRGLGKRSGRRWTWGLALQDAEGRKAPGEELCLGHSRIYNRTASRMGSVFPCSASRSYAYMSGKLTFLVRCWLPQEDSPQQHWEDKHPCLTKASRASSEYPRYWLGPLQLARLSLHLYPAPQAPPFCFPHCSHSNRNLVTSPSNYSLLTASSCLRIKTKALREAYRAPAHFTALCPCSLLQPPWPVSFSTSPCFLQPQDIGTRSSLWHLTPPPQPQHSFHLSAQLLLPQKAILLQHTFAWHRVHPPWLPSPCNLY